ncbi:MAG: PP2C family protein-serine/threonine phosphatase, partial [Butyrivibrio sp.]|nr:PP2C family protein-serine/threonine phosphatase [Butyrivibrio sp.]
STLADRLDEYQSLTWLMDYWKDNAKELVTDDYQFVENGDMKDVMKKLSRDQASDVTEEDIGALTEDEKKTFAVGCYNEIQKIFDMYSDEEESLGVILTLYGEDEEPTALITNYSQDGIFLGVTADVKEVQQTIENTDLAREAEVWKWAFSTPSKAMIFGTSYALTGYKGSKTAEILGVFSADLVYDGMQYTGRIRNDVIFMMITIFILLLLFLYYIVPRPLARVKKCVTEYAENKDTEALTKELSGIRSRNEIGALADEFSAMAIEMERYTHEMETLAAEKERVETELNVAQNIQMQMLPHQFPEGKDFSLYASMEPAKEVGGDFYDCYMIDSDHLALTIADVSGKGVPAALFMSVSKTMLKNRTLVGGKPSEILADVNNWLCEGNDSCMFVTVWHGILTVSTGELICANAGHENPGIRTGDGDFRLIRTEHGMMLGVMPELTFTDEHYKLNPGDALFVYTDGVPEANTTDESMFGEDKLESVLQNVMKEDTPQDVMKKVRGALSVFVGEAPQYDDLTMLCLVMNPTDKKE